MASKSNDDRLPRGVRGPGGPPPAGARGGTPRPTPSAAGRGAFQQRSLPLLRWMHALPRWLVVIAPAIFLFVGLVLTGPVAWLGGLLLLLVALFLAWLTALSWPAISPSARALRVLVVAALVGIAVFKFLGRF